MRTLALTLSDSEAEFVARQAAAGGFESAEAYILSLVAAARRRFEERHRTVEAGRVE